MTPDELAVHCTAFHSFVDLVEYSVYTGYVPSLYPWAEELPTDREYNFRRWELCQVFDDWMILHGLEHRAWRGWEIKDRSWTSYAADA